MTLPAVLSRQVGLFWELYRILATELKDCGLELSDAPSKHRPEYG